MRLNLGKLSLLGILIFALTGEKNIGQKSAMAIATSKHSEYQENLSKSSVFQFTDFLAQLPQIIIPPPFPREPIIPRDPIIPGNLPVLHSVKADRRGCLNGSDQIVLEGLNFGTQRDNLMPAIASAESFGFLQYLDIVSWSNTRIVVRFPFLSENIRTGQNYVIGLWDGFNWLGTPRGPIFSCGTENTLRGKIDRLYCDSREFTVDLINQDSQVIRSHSPVNWNGAVLQYEFQNVPGGEYILRPRFIGRGCPNGVWFPTNRTVALGHRQLIVKDLRYEVVPERVRIPMTNVINLIQSELSRTEVLFSGAWPAERQDSYIKLNLASGGTYQHPFAIPTVWFYIQQRSFSVRANDMRLSNLFVGHERGDLKLTFNFRAIQGLEDASGGLSVRLNIDVFLPLSSSQQGIAVQPPRNIQVSLETNASPLRPRESCRSYTGLCDAQRRAQTQLRQVAQDNFNQFFSREDVRNRLGQILNSRFAPRNSSAIVRTEIDGDDLVLYFVSR